MRKIVNIDELMIKKEEILKDLRLIPKEEKDYTEYSKIMSKIKYYTNDKDKKVRENVNIDELMIMKEEILKELKEIPNKERDYTEYRKITMKIKYYTNDEVRKRINDKSNLYIKKIYEDEEKRKKFADNQLLYLHKRKEREKKC